jgi:hypothetical protein
MLGARQKQWLKDRLKASKAVFKVIVSDVPVSKGAKPGSKDAWDGFPDEREEMLSYIETEKIDGAFIVSSDRHRSDHWVIQRPQSKVAGEQNYPIQEFMSAMLTNIMSHDLIKGSEFGYNDKNSFGELVFDMESADPSVTYKIHSVDGEEVYAYTVKRSQMMRVPAELGKPDPYKGPITDPGTDPNTTGIGPGPVERNKPRDFLGITFIAGENTRFVAFSDLDAGDATAAPRLSLYGLDGKLRHSWPLGRLQSRLVQVKVGERAGKISAGNYLLKLDYGGREYTRAIAL